MIVLYSAWHPLFETHEKILSLVSVLGTVASSNQLNILSTNMNHIIDHDLFFTLATRKLRMKSVSHTSNFSLPEFFTYF